jgi:predicted AlkP superfamily phosphohydrolase/phosphomutase
VRELNAGRPDLVMAYLHRIDLVSHHFWKYFEPEKYPSVAARGSKTDEALFFDGYRVTDKAVGAILAAAPADATVIVVSDHGFQGIEEYKKIRYNLARTLEVMGLLQHVQKRVVDWSQTRLYAYNSPDMRDRKMLRVNLVGRDPNGIVPASQKDAVMAEAREKLGAITYTDSGLPAFRFEEPRAKEDCDLVIVANQEGAGLALSYQGKALPRTVTEVKEHSGGHGNDTPGVFFAAGPNIQQGARLDDPSIFDITPTVLHLLGLPVGEDMAGRVLTELFTPGWLAAHPVQTIPTWETGERQGQTTESAADDEMLEELRALGYIE